MKKHVLIVDDEDTLSAALKAKFEVKGFAVTTSNNGMLGLKKLNSEYFDALVLDIMMPEKDGFGVMTELPTTKNPNIPVFVITNLGAEEDCDKAFELGARACYIKSRISLKDVVEEIGQAIA